MFEFLLRYISGIILILLFSLQVSYCSNDSLSFNPELKLTLSEKNKLPFWVRSNQNGMFRYGTQLLVNNINYKKDISKKITTESGFGLVTNLESGQHIFHEYFVKTSYQNFELRIGAFSNTLGYTAKGLSTGSLAISENASPIPQIGLITKEAISLPFIGDYVRFKGGISHRWFDANRCISNSYLHEKHFYIFSGPKVPLSFYGGLVHLAVWGGTLSSGDKIIPDFKYFIKVLTASGSNNDVPIYGEAQNKAGNHLGIYDFGARFKIFNNRFKVYTYYQVPFEDGSGMQLLRNPDKLLGIKITDEENSLWWKSVLVEYMNTCFQSGQGTPDLITGQPSFGFKGAGRDDYYNNYLYQTGWVYQNNVIGTPLFYTKEQGRTLLGQDFGDYGDNIINNRVICEHIALTGKLRKKIKYKAFVTHTINFGTYTGLQNGRYNWAALDPDFDQTDYYFYHPQKQTYLGLNLDYTHRSLGSWKLNTSYLLAADFGQLYNTFAFLFTLKLNYNI